MADLFVSPPRISQGLAAVETIEVRGVHLTQVAASKGLATAEGVSLLCSLRECDRLHLCLFKVSGHLKKAPRWPHHDGIWRRSSVEVTGSATSLTSMVLPGWTSVIDAMLVQLQSAAARGHERRAERVLARRLGR